jgi:uroporphyrinogen-III synthase
MSLAGLRVLSLESRRAKDMESLIIRQGGVPFVAPSVKERAVEDHSVALHFIERLEAGEIEMVICMTGVGLTFLRDVLASQVPVERLSNALRRATIMSRGPKPVPVLRSLQVPIDIMIPEPNTWREIVAAIAPRPERKIAIQEYGRPNLEMNTALEALGATLIPVSLYRWELPDDLEPLRRAVRGLTSDQFDVAVFTSSVQLDHLLEVAGGLGLSDEVICALKERIVVASVGPVMTASLVGRGLAPDVIPQSPKMGSLIMAMADQAGAALQRKRNRDLRSVLPPAPPSD